VTALRNCESHHATYPSFLSKSVDPEEEANDRGELDGMNQKNRDEFRKSSRMHTIFARDTLLR
jgi:hypothetical protein